MSLADDSMLINYLVIKRKIIEPTKNFQVIKKFLTKIALVAWVDNKVLILISIKMHSKITLEYSIATQL